MSFPEEVPQGTKVCRKCGDEKPRAEFPPHNVNKDGLQSRCRECCNGALRQYRSTAPGRKTTRACYDRRYRSPRGRATHLINAARKRKAVTVSIEQIEAAIAAGVCAVTGIRFDLEPAAANVHHNPLAPSLDRIDPAGDYTPENTQVVIWAYNLVKGEQTQEDTKALLKRISEAL